MHKMKLSFKITIHIYIIHADQDIDLNVANFSRTVTIYRIYEMHEYNIMYDQVAMILTEK